MRIIAGKYKNKEIATTIRGMPEGHFRPTQSKVRAAVLNKLRFMPIAGAQGFAQRRILDLCCGSGAFGLEALSQGALSITFIDSSPNCIKLVRHNIANFAVEQYCQVICSDIGRLAANLGQAFDVVYIDPPYRDAQVLHRALNLLQQGNWLASGCVMAIETAVSLDVIPPAGWVIDSVGKYGGTKVSYIIEDVCRQ